MTLRSISPDSPIEATSLSQATSKKKKSVSFNHNVAVVDYSTNQSGIDLRTRDIATTVFGKKGKPKRIAIAYREKTIPSEKLPGEFNKLNKFFKSKIVTGLKDTSTFRKVDFYKHDELIKQATRSTEFKGENTDYSPVFGYDKETQSHVLVLTCSIKSAVVLSHDSAANTSTLKELDYANLQLYVEKDEESELGRKVLIPPKSPIDMELASNVLSEYTLNPVKSRKSPTYEYRKEHCDLDERDITRQNGLGQKRERVTTYRNAAIVIANNTLKALRASSSH